MEAVESPRACNARDAKSPIAAQSKRTSKKRPPGATTTPIRVPRFGSLAEKNWREALEAKARAIAVGAGVNNDPQKLSHDMPQTLLLIVIFCPEVAYTRRPRRRSDVVGANSATYIRVSFRLCIAYTRCLLRFPSYIRLSRSKPTTDSQISRSVIDRQG